MKFILGVTGSIAAYKIPVLLRLLKKAGHDVQVIMTENAQSFVTPLTLSTLSGKMVYSDFTTQATGQWVNHVDLALWADILIIAPASANSLAKMAHGLCDNILLATYLSAVCPVFIAPAMDRDMYLNQATQENVGKLSSRGVHIIPPVEGELASGIQGIGRMAEPEDIFAILTKP